MKSKELMEKSQNHLKEFKFWKYFKAIIFKLSTDRINITIKTQFSSIYNCKKIKIENVNFI